MTGSQSRALCALHKPARSVRYPDSLRSIRTQIRFWCQKLHKNATPLIVTAVLNSTRAALTRAMHSNRRPLDTVSLSTACSNRRMGCICCYYQINNCAVSLRLQGVLYDGLSRNNWCVHPPRRIDFTNFINQVQLMLFVKHFLFFPPGAADSTLKGTLPCTARLSSRLQEELTVGLAWLWGKRRKPCVKQSQNGSVLDLFVAVNRRRKSFRRKLHRSKNWTEWNNFVKIVKRSCIVPNTA